MKKRKSLKKTMMANNDTVCIKAFAKVNLTLEVLGMRNDGFHELRSVVMPISLYDEIEIAKDSVISCDSGIEGDLMERAAKLLDIPGCRMHIKKNIPLGGGLGGGSADAAAVLIALNDLYRLGLNRETLAQLGAKIGSDIPALVYRQAVIMEGRGEIVTPLFAADEHCPRLYLVLANPRIHCETKEVFKKVISRVTNAGEILYNMRTSLLGGNAEHVAKWLWNDLESPAIKLHPAIGELKERLENMPSVYGSLMSGSGSSVFGIVASRDAADEVAKEMRSLGYDAWSVYTIVR